MVMGVAWAIEQAEFGRLIRREAWDEGFRIDFIEVRRPIEDEGLKIPIKRLRDNTQRKYLSNEDLKAEDWVSFEEEPEEKEEEGEEDEL